MKEKPYQVRLEEIFEGPMDLLIHLIRKNDLDIYDIPIALITDQYLQYLELMQAMNIDYAGDFLLMASSLTQIKSRMLLPTHDGEEDEEDPLQEITRPLAGIPADEVGRRPADRAKSAGREHIYQKPKP